MEGARLGPYELVTELGSGGMGTVFRAEVVGPVPGLDPGAAVAVKVIHPHLLRQAGFFKRFLREARIGQEVRHDNVVRTWDCDATELDGQATHYLVMEYVEGQTLRDLLEELELVPEELCRHIGRETAKGLAAIHAAGVIHRDLKPENVLITPDHVVKVMGLGVARLQDEAVRLSQTGAFVGSLEYAAPEQLGTAEGEPDARADLHALGVMLYELATGQHPYRDADASRLLRNILHEAPRKAGERNPQLSPFFEELVHALLAKDPNERLPSASDVATTLEQGERSTWWGRRARALRVETRRPLRRIRIPRTTALYGRDDDLARLHVLYERARSGSGRVLLIVGEAGIGKTRLVDEFVGRLRQEGEDVEFLFGSYPPGGAATAAGAFSEAYREHFGTEGLEEALAEYLTPTSILVPAFAAILKGSTTPTGAEPLTKDSLQTAFVHATRGLASRRTTIVLIDDLHFAPEDGRALFSSLALAVPGHRILLIGTMRPGVPEEWTASITRLEHAEQRSLPRLGLKDFSALLKDAFQSERLAHELGMKIAEKSDGNPFFAFEIIRGLREGQLIARQSDGTWATTRSFAEILVPSTIQDLVDARIADLSDEERALLEVGSCCGFEFDPELVGEVLGLAPIPALQLLGRIEKRSRIVRSAGVDYVFDHHQIQETLYAGLNARLRAHYHHAIGEALERRHDAPGGRDDSANGAFAVRVSGHLLQGTEPRRVLPYLEPALGYLESRHRHGHAVRLAEDALGRSGLLEGAERVALLLRLGAGDGAYQNLGRYAAAEAACAAVERWATDAGDDHLLASAACASGTALLKLARWEEAEAALRRSLDAGRRAGDVRLECRVHTTWGNVHYYRGQKPEAVERYTKALTLGRALGDERLAARLQNNLASVYLSLGRFEEAQSHLDQALEVFAAPEDVRERAAIAGNGAALSYARGRLEEARRRCAQYAAESQALGRRWGIANSAAILGEIDLGCGRLPEAEAHFGQGTTLYAEIGVPAEHAITRFGMARVHLARGEREQGAAMIDELLAEARALGVADLECDCVLATGRLLWEEGRADAAREMFLAARPLVERLQLPDPTVLAPCHLALVSPGDVASAQAALRDHEPRMSVLSALEAHWLLWKATGSVRHLTAAKRRLDDLLEHVSREHHASMLGNVRLHREIVEAYNAQGVDEER